MMSTSMSVVGTCFWERSKLQKASTWLKPLHSNLDRIFPVKSITRAPLRKCSKRCPSSLAAGKLNCHWWTFCLLGVCKISSASWKTLKGIAKFGIGTVSEDPRTESIQSTYAILMTVFSYCSVFTYSCSFELQLTMSYSQFVHIKSHAVGRDEYITYIQYELASRTLHSESLSLRAWQILLRS